MRRRFVHQPSSKTTCFSAGGSRSRFPSAGTLASWPTLMLERLQLLNVSRLGMLEIYTETMDSSQITGDLTKVSKVGNVWGKSLIRKYFRKGSSALGKEWLVDNYVSFILMFSSELHLQSYALVSCKLWFWFAIARSWLSIYIYMYIYRYKDIHKWRLGLERGETAGACKDATRMGAPVLDSGFWIIRIRRSPWDPMGFCCFLQHLLFNATCFFFESLVTCVRLVIVTFCLIPL